MDTMDEINRQANALITQEVERRAKAWLQGAMGVDWEHAFEQIVKERDTLRRQLDCAVGALNRIGGHLPTGICRQALNQIEAIGKRESS